MLPISESEVITRLRFDNPWWDELGIEERFEKLPRRQYFSAFHTLLTDTSINRAVVLMGPRRVGKTVIVYHAISELLKTGVNPNTILYLCLETPIYTGLTLDNIRQTFAELFSHKRSSPLYIFFDEVQYHKDWETHLKSLVDSYPSYRFTATGSAAAALRLKSKESGAGRFTDFLLPPLTFSEYVSFVADPAELLDVLEYQDEMQITAKNINEFNQHFINYMNFGGYPEAVFSETVKHDVERFIKSDIIDKVLLRDLPSLYGISDTQELNQLFTMLAYNTGQEISLEALSKSANLSKNTLKRYIEYLEAAFLIKIVHRVDQNSKKFKRATAFKVYLTNPSMRAALFGPIKDDSEAIGSLAETAIYAQWFHGSSAQNLYYARWKGGEVDIVYLRDHDQSPIWCVEVKWTDLPFTNIKKLKSLTSYLNQNTLHERALVTSKTLSGIKNIDGHDIEFIPSSLYAYKLGANIHASRR